MATLLHIPTLILVAGLGSLCVFMTMLYTWLSDRRRAEVGLWALGYGIFSLAALLVALRGQISDVLSITVGNMLLLAAQGLHLLGYRQFTSGDGRRFLVPAMLGAAAWLAFAAAGQGYDDVNIRTAVVSLLSIANTVLIPFMLWRHYRREPLPSLRLTAVAAAVHCLSLAARSAFALLAPIASTANPFQTSLPVAVSMLESALFLVFVGIMQMALIGQRSERRFRIASQTDELTGLCNRRHFLAQVLPQLATHGERGALLIFDLDHFKDINDRHGHREGDRVLIAFARLASGELRPSDLFARSGGEEFVLFLPEADAGAARRLASRICRRLAAFALESCEGAAIRVTVSCGFATVSDSGANYDTLFTKADGALYMAKQAGRNRVRMAGEAEEPAMALLPGLGEGVLAFPNRPASAAAAGETAAAPSRRYRDHAHRPRR